MYYCIVKNLGSKKVWWISTVGSLVEKPWQIEVHLHICICLCVHAFVCVYAYVCVCVCIIRMYVCLCKYVCMLMYVCTCLCMYVCMLVFVCMHVCMCPCLSSGLLITTYVKWICINQLNKCYNFQSLYITLMNGCCLSNKAYHECLLNLKRQNLSSTSRLFQKRKHFNTCTSVTKWSTLQLWRSVGVRDVTIYWYIAISWYIKPVIQYRY